MTEEEQAFRQRLVAQSRAASAKRKGWLPDIAEPLRWQVVELPGFVFEVMLTDGTHYSKRELTGACTRWRWFFTGREMLKRFSKERVYSETADEFVARMNTQAH